MKKKSFVVLLVVLISLVFMCGNSFAGWTQPKGTAYTQLSFNYFVSDDKYTTVHTDDDDPTNITVDDEVEFTSSPKFESRNFSFYGQYGITDKMHLTLSIPFAWLDSGNVVRYGDSHLVSGIGDINLGVRHQLLNVVGGLLSAEGMVKIPEAYEYGDPLSDLNLGKGQYDVYLGITYGRGFGKGYGWMNLGYNYRSDIFRFLGATTGDDYSFKPSDEIKISMGGGYPIPLVKKVSVRGMVAYARSVGNSSISEDMYQHARDKGQAVDTEFGKEALELSTLALESDSLSVGGSLVLNLPVQVVLGYTTNIGGFWEILSKNTGKGETYSITAVKSF